MNCSIRKQIIFSKPSSPFGGTTYPTLMRKTATVLKTVLHKFVMVILSHITTFQHSKTMWLVPFKIPPTVPACHQTSNILQLQRIGTTPPWQWNWIPNPFTSNPSPSFPFIVQTKNQQVCVHRANGCLWPHLQYSEVLLSAPLSTNHPPKTLH